jgi:hypothetical protein
MEQKMKQSTLFNFLTESIQQDLQKDLKELKK